MVTAAVVPTCLVRAASLNSLIASDSAPSVVRSLARVWEKENPPVAPTAAEPVRAPLLKSAALMPVPDSDQYSSVPTATLVVWTVVVRIAPSLRDAAEGVMP